LEDDTWKKSLARIAGMNLKPTMRMKWFWAYVLIVKTFPAKSSRILKTINYPGDRATGPHQIPEEITMTREKLNALLCAIISTLAEVEYSPESTLYLGIGSDLEDWNTVKSVLLAGELATVENYTVRITQKGRDLAAKVNAFVAAH
jgi:hypothetical protein